MGPGSGRACPPRVAHQLRELPRGEAGGLLAGWPQQCGGPSLTPPATPPSCLGWARRRLLSKDSGGSSPTLHEGFLVFPSKSLEKLFTFVPCHLPRLLLGSTSQMVPMCPAEHRLEGARMLLGPPWHQCHPQGPSGGFVQQPSQGGRGHKPQDSPPGKGGGCGYQTKGSVGSGVLSLFLCLSPSVSLSICCLRLPASSLPPGPCTWPTVGPT